jgi:hypothetical protein
LDVGRCFVGSSKHRHRASGSSCCWTPRRLSGGETVDVIDAAVIDVATNGDEVLTSDPQDLAVLAYAAGKGLTIIKVG